MTTDTRIYKVAITADGKFVYGKQYDVLVQVLYATEDGGDGCSYVSIKPNRNVIPGTDPTTWVKSTERGAQGTQGPQGIQGPPGPSAELPSNLCYFGDVIETVTINEP